MANFIIKTLKDLFGNAIYPKTKEKAIYDDNNVRLDNKLVDSFLSNKGIVSSNLNFNDLIKPGMYQAALTTGMTNHPNIGHYLEINVYVGGPFIIQECTSVITLKKAYRKGEGGGTLWSAWSYSLSTLDIVQSDLATDYDKVVSAYVMSVVSGRVNAISNRLGSSVNGQDMNNVVNTGLYSGYNATNVAVSGISVFKVLNYSPDWIYQEQILIKNDGSISKYYRTRYNGTTWGAWCKEDNGVGYLEGVHNLNTFKDSGRYTIGPLQNIANAPLNGTFVIDNCGVYVRQSIVNNGGKMAIRMSVDQGSTWDSWYILTGTKV